MVPPGAHIITTTLLAPERCVPTVASWVYVKPGAVEVARWEPELGRFCRLQDRDEARLVPPQMTGGSLPLRRFIRRSSARWAPLRQRALSTWCCMQAQRYRLGVQRFDFDSGLAPYPLHSQPQWQALSCYIDQVRPSQIMLHEAAALGLALISCIADPFSYAPLHADPRWSGAARLVRRRQRACKMLFLSQWQQLDSPALEAARSTK